MTKKLSIIWVVLLAIVVLCGCTPIHQHSFDEAWSSDETNHYHQSNCGHDVVDGLEKHTYGQGVTQGENIVYTCTVCNYTKTEPIPHEHTYSTEWSSNETHHWYEATCGHNVKDSEGEHTFDLGELNAEKTAIVYTCADCGYQKSENHQHTYTGEWIISKDATIFEEGLKFRYCTRIDCDEKQTEIIAKVAVSSIDVTVQPTKTAYKVGETFDPTGIVVNAVGQDNSKTDVTTQVSYDKTTLVLGDTTVTVTFQGKTAVVEITVEEATSTSVLSVSQARNSDNFETQVTVEGYFAGVSDEGYGQAREILLKDTNSDELIAVRHLPDSYGTWPNVGYQVGDKVQICGTLVNLQYGVNDAIQTKVYLDFAVENNPANVDDTIVSTSNKVEYNLDQVTELSSWTQWKNLFVAETFEAYTYIKITGKVFLNTYVSKDEINIHRIHANAAATTLVHIKPDSARALGLRQNSLEANIGTDWRNLFDYQTDSGSKVYPGEEKDVEIIAVVTSFNSVNYQLTILSADWVKVVKEEPFTNEQVLQEVAWAFYRQGTQAEYDMTKGRRDVNSSPEDATDDDALILDCSSYANAVYYEAFGESIIKGNDGSSTAMLTSYAQSYAGTKNDVVGYWETADYTTEEEKQQVLYEVKNLLQVGDCIVYRHGKTSGSGGHVMVYVGNNTILHSTGTSYNYASDATLSYDKATKDEHKISTVQTMPLDVLFEKESDYPKRYLFYTSTSDSTFNFSVLRPLNRGLTPTEESKNRMSVQGIDMEKSVSVGAYSAICNNSEVTYNLRLTNTSAVDLKNVTFNETLDDYVSFVSSESGVTANGKTISWMGDVAANTTVNVSYVVSVSTTQKQATVVSKCTVNGVNLNTIYNTVSHYTAEQLQSVADFALQKGNEGATYNNPIDFVKDAYQSTLGVALGEYTGVSASLTDLIDTTNKTFRNDTEFSKMLAPHLYGGVDIYAGYTSDSKRARLVEKANLAVGDVILAEKNGKSMAAIYLGEGKLVVIYSATDVCQIVDVGNEEYHLSDGYYILDTVLAQLISYDRYAVVRPSFN